MGWNYPPGVTGYEPEIAGHEEISLVVDCDNEMYDAIGRADVLALIQSFVVGGSVEAARLRLKEEIDRLHTYYVPCEYSGYVTGYIVGSTVEWECPRCGETHVEEP